MRSLFCGVRRTLRRGLCAAALGAVMLAAAGPHLPAAAAPKTVVIAVEGDPLGLDPHTHALWLTFRVVSGMFEGLVRQDLTVSDVPITPIVPALAESWTISDDGLDYVFKLRKGVRFHDGEPWNAEAAKFNFDRIINRSAPQFYEKAYQLNTWWREYIASYEVVDDYTFKIRLTQPNAEFLYWLAQGGVGSATFASPKALKATGNDDFASHPVGTGPFKFVERIFGDRIVLERNADYWDPARTPKYDRLIYRPIVDVAAREQALLTGAADIISTPSPDSTDFIAQQGFKIVQGPVPTIYMLWLNFKDPALKDVRVRRALSMAIDREGMSAKLRKGQASAAYSILNVGGPGYDPSFVCDPYNPDEAKKLLAEAGYADGLKIRMDWTPGGAGDVNTIADAEWIQRNFAAIGVTASIEVFDIGTYFTQMNQGMREGTGIMQISWGENTSNWLDSVVSPAGMPPNGYNSGWYDNPRVTEILAAARKAPTTKELDAHLKELRDTVCQDAAFIPTHSPLGVYAMSPKIKGFVLAPQHWNDMAIIDKQ